MLTGKTPADAQSGHPGHLTPDQQATLTSFRTLLANTTPPLIPASPAREEHTAKLGYDRYSDAALLRFLRARKFDQERAKEMWAANEVWRASFGADELAADGFPYPEASQVIKYYPQFYHKTDLRGRPLYIEQLGKLDIPKLYAITTQERQLKRLVAEYEKSFRERWPACTEAQRRGGKLAEGEVVETSCTILDLYNAGISSFYRVKDYVMAASAIGQNNCKPLAISHSQPETMGHMFIINAPYLFSTIWSLIKPWLDEATVRKIHILGRNYKSELLEYIPKEHLPVALGGSCVCGGEGGCEMGDAGPWNVKAA
ncbi:Sec14 cytosolic factor [Cryptococcus wingfieldii CBS 7118]|uniref:Sec14 cytosolic factor n=1 Tax=Cryptococcus wingfieldii CBS 7118 TaxID=1295528 RepID=A0A1E3J3D0_9TREE|nr:Sec14 cytosolic factor [Cryptococcus wingfieldii CBS 7118]ODN95370.1 Sec14 cytosolic factor [Cryptococcus wingfieldii CBS 7118]